jgi:hypothetical protein
MIRIKHEGRNLKRCENWPPLFKEKIEEIFKIARKKKVE